MSTLPICSFRDLPVATVDSEEDPELRDADQTSKDAEHHRRSQSAPPSLFDRAKKSLSPVAPPRRPLTPFPSRNPYTHSPSLSSFARLSPLAQQTLRKAASQPALVRAQAAAEQKRLMKKLEASPLSESQALTFLEQILDQKVPDPLALFSTVLLKLAQRQKTIDPNLVARCRQCLDKFPTNENLKRIVDQLGKSFG